MSAEGRDGLDRRDGTRMRTVAEHGVTAVRVRPGIQATLLDLSTAGAALETDRRLLPGRFVHVQFSHRGGIATMRARVVRNEVSELTAGAVVYRCAVHFDHPWAFGP